MLLKLLNARQEQNSYYVRSLHETDIRITDILKGTREIKYCYDQTIISNNSALTRFGTSISII